MTLMKLTIGRAVALGLAGLILAGPAAAEILITEREAKLPSDDTVERGVLPGPKVLLISPSRRAGAVKSPVNLELKFEGRGGVTVDINSLNVIYKKIPPVDLTPRVKEFVRPDGIDMPSAEVPPGVHKIHVDIKDVEGRIGGTEFTLTVAP